MKIKFLCIETSKKTKLKETFFALNQRRCRREPLWEFEDACIEEIEEEEKEEDEEEEEEEQDVSTQFLQTKKFKSLICRITWKDIATFFQYLASTAQNTTKIQ